MSGSTTNAFTQGMAMLKSSKAKATIKKATVSHQLAMEEQFKHDSAFLDYDNLHVGNAFSQNISDYREQNSLKPQEWGPSFIRNPADGKFYCGVRYNKRVFYFDEVTTPTLVDVLASGIPVFIVGNVSWLPTSTSNIVDAKSFYDQLKVDALDGNSKLCKEWFQIISKR
ncbi:hypothetical protein [Acetobacter persici]|uniref:hypothetical protein n=1 Tax=Acetobacter persici TaxID=1076596 RepID=UPI001BAAA67F|nr:hypothetical protein [Acetobacter persici]MBS1015396.1 hypothetical protein [Acetobacter persici]